VGNVVLFAASGPRPDVFLVTRPCLRGMIHAHVKHFKVVLAGDSTVIEAVIPLLHRAQTITVVNWVCV
jgi:hypothetical protein